jgi:hypothetical protein
MMEVRTEPPPGSGAILNQHDDDGHVLDVLHSAKHLYLCLSWCARASHQELMVEKYIAGIDALRQPPIALKILLDHCTIKEVGDLESINGAIPEPFVRTAEAIHALLGRHETEPAWRRPELPTARAAHAWKWLRRAMFGNFRVRNFSLLFPIFLILLNDDTYFYFQYRSLSVKYFRSLRTTCARWIRTTFHRT